MPNKSNMQIFSFKKGSYVKMKQLEKILKGSVKKKQKNRKPISCLEIVKNAVLEAQESFASKFKKKKNIQKTVLWVNKKAKEGVLRKGWHSRSGELD